MNGISDVRDISKIAYGFMGSQALVAALDIKLFAHLSENGGSAANLAAAVDLRQDRLEMLLTPLLALRLLEFDGDIYRNAPATQKYLVPDAPEYFGEYIRLQVGKQVYPHAMKIGQMLAGAPAKIYEEVADSPEMAADFSHSQHLGSLGPAYLLAKSLQPGKASRLLDVAGGSGAFTVQLCKRFPELDAIIVDFAAVIDVAKSYIDEAGLNKRVDYRAGNALDIEWPGGNDIVLMSYLFSAVGDDEINQLLSKAFDAIEPGGQLIVHDFMVDDDKRGPASAALWMMVLAGTDSPVCLTAADIARRVEAAGFADIASADLVPTITRVVTARKPA
jgi:SAM-dependent methyltransferase